MRNLFVALILMVFPTFSQASVIETALPDPELRGKAVFRFVGLPVYEARLFTDSGTPLDWSRDFGLELVYKRSLSKEALVGSTMDELARIGHPLPVRDQLSRCFDKVGKGDRYLAVTQGQDRIGFWRNGAKVCTLRYPKIARHFMSIFLGDNTRSASFTRRLRGN